MSDAAEVRMLQDRVAELSAANARLNTRAATAEAEVARWQWIANAIAAKVGPMFTEGWRAGYEARRGT